MRVTIPFTKMVGAGNDFIVVEPVRARINGLARRWSAVSRALCDRQRGVGADGVLLITPSRKADARMRIFNADGSEAEMCGNGARCVARFLSGRNGHGARLTIETGAGEVQAAVAGERVSLRLPDPTGVTPRVTVSVNGRTISGGSINTSVPHMVVRVPNLDRVDVAGLGRALRRHPAFAPRGTNVNFIQPDGTAALRIRTYERGVEAETLACGTGATAAAILHGVATGARRVTVRTRSGDTLNISFRLVGPGRITGVTLEGPARRVYDGRISV